MTSSISNSATGIRGITGALAMAATLATALAVGVGAAGNPGSTADSSSAGIGRPASSAGMVVAGGGSGESYFWGG